MCCAGSDMELIEGAFFSASVFAFPLFWIKTAQKYVNNQNTVRKVVKLCSNE